MELFYFVFGFMIGFASACALAVYSYNRSKLQEAQETDFTI